MRLVSIGRGFSLDEKPAASFNLAVAKRPGLLGLVNTAYRTREFQQQLYAAYLAGRGAFAMKPGTSKHEIGMAIDIDSSPMTPDFQWWLANCEHYGFKRTNPDEPWHFEYFEHLDQSASEDDMYTDDDRKRDQLTHEAVARIEREVAAVKGIVQKNNDALFATAPTSRGSSAGVLAVLGKIEKLLPSLTGKG